MPLALLTGSPHETRQERCGFGGRSSQLGVHVKPVSEPRAERRVTLTVSHIRQGDTRLSHDPWLLRCVETQALRRLSLFPYPLFVVALLYCLAPRTLFAAADNRFDLSVSLVPVAQIHHGGPVRDGIPAIDRPRFLSAGQADYLQDSDRVLGDRHKAYPLAELSRTNGELYDRIANEHVVIRFDAANRTGSVFAANGQEIPSTIAYWFAWQAFHPDTEVYAAP